jgi:hypothetical protein
MRTIITVALTLLVTALLAVGGLIAWEFSRANSSDFIDETFESAILGETVTIHTRLPWRYDEPDEQGFPLVIKLDGDARLNWHDSVLATLSEVDGTDAIVVGVSNGRGQRNRNLTPTGWPQELESPEPVGEGDRFLDFLEQELVPHLEARYQTNGRRVLVGYSRGGLLAAYAYTSGRTGFDSFVALSPALWREENRIAEHVAGMDAGTGGLAPCLFLSLGDAENSRMQGGYSAFLEGLDASHGAIARRRSHMVAGGAHQTTPYYALPHAYRFVLGDNTICG